MNEPERMSALERLASRVMPWAMLAFAILMGGGLLLWLVIGYLGDEYGMWP
jgi:hypothetical protein